MGIGEQYEFERTGRIDPEPSQLTVVAEKPRIVISDERKKHLDQHIKYWKQSRPVSEIGYRVADLLDIWLGGLHHLDHDVAVKANWWDHYIELKWRFRPLTTFDGDNLTRLVFLSHDKLIRVDIDPLTVGMFRFMFHCRHSREGGLCDRFPTIETQLSRWRENHPESATGTA